MQILIFLSGVITGAMLYGFWNSRTTPEQMRMTATKRLLDTEAKLMTFKSITETNRTLERAILQDAMNREARAKAALSAMARQMNVSEQNLQKILDAVDGDTQ